MQMTDFTLPEFVFFDGSGSQDDILFSRTIIHHVRTATTIEAIALDDVETLSLKDGVKNKTFEYNNRLGTNEKFVLAVHISIIDEDEVDEVIDKAWKWYSSYLDWEDDGIVRDSQTKNN